MPKRRRPFRPDGAPPPRDPERAAERTKLLFVCSRNQWRSPTAERVWRRHPDFSVRSAGTSSAARRRVSADDVAWADVIFVMEDKHRARLAADFGAALRGKTVHVLEIPDDYGYMDPELVEILEDAVAPLLGLD